MVHALKTPAPASTFRKFSDKHIAEISDLRNISKKGNINQVQTKQIQEQPEIQPIENNPEKQLQTKTNYQDKGLHLISPEEPSKLPRVKPEGSPRVNPDGLPRKQKI